MSNKNAAYYFYDKLLKEPTSQKSFIDFTILYRWVISGFMFISFGFLLIFSWYAATISMIILSAIWYALFKLVYKRIENKMNKVKNELHSI